MMTHLLGQHVSVTPVTAMVAADVALATAAKDQQTN